MVLYSLTPSLKDQMAQTAVSADAVKNCNKKIDTFKLDAEKAALAKETKELTLTLTVEEINSKLIEILAEGELPIKEAFVNFTDDRIWVYAEITAVPVPAKIVMIGDAAIVKDKIHTNVDVFKLGRLPLPSSTIEQVNSLSNIIVKMELPFDYLPIKITSIGVSNNSLILKVLTIPKA